MRYTDESINYSLRQSEMFSAANVAVLSERSRLEQNVLMVARSWCNQNIAEKAFAGNAALEKVVRELLEFEGRHGLYKL